MRVVEVLHIQCFSVQGLGLHVGSSMSCCRRAARTPLERHAAILAAENDGSDGAAPMHFPMYTIPADVLLEMTEIRPHEDLLAMGLLTAFDGTQGKAGLVSHQWAARDHPDPEMKQMRVFQDALRHLLKDKGIVPLDCITETFLTSAKAIALTAFQSEALFLWYDYFSVPQVGDSHNQAKAIQSIPAYVAACSFFFALVPFIEDTALSPMSWSHRGWCRHR